jgi:hypothetical protein
LGAWCGRKVLARSGNAKRAVMFPVSAATGGELWVRLRECDRINQPETDEAEHKDGEQAPHGLIVLMKKVLLMKKPAP